MLEKPHASSSIGLEIEGSVLKGVRLSYTKGKPRFEKLFEIAVQWDHVKPLYHDPQTEPFLKEIDKALVVTTLSTQETLIRPLEIKLKKEKDIEEVLHFQTEPLLPYPADQALLDYVKIGSTEEGTLLTILAARKDHLQKHLEQWAKLQVEPEAITSVPAALANFAAIFTETDQPLCLAHLGLDQTTCLIVQDGKLIASQSFPQGMENLKKALLNENEGSINLGNIDISQINAETHPVIYSAWDVLRLEIKRMIFSLSKQTKGLTLQKLMVTGTGALVPHLASSLAQDLEKQLINPQQDLFPSLTIGQIQQFAIPIGAALNGLPLANNPLNFRQGDLAYPHPWKRLQKSIALYAGLCVLLAGAFYLLGQSYLAYREDQIRQSYIDLLTVMNKPFDTFEKELEKKNPTKNSTLQLLGVRELSEHELSYRVDNLDKELESNPELFPLLPNIPKVSDVLAWLSTQQVLVGKKSRGDSKNPPSLQVESFNYTLIKRPEHNKKQEKYQVKVELEFTSPTPKLAREFHDALIEPNALIDPKGEVKWNSSHGRYRTSFFLKDRTVYPGQIQP